MNSVFNFSNPAYDMSTRTKTGIRTFNKNIGAWNMGGVTTMVNMFNGAAAFNNGETGNTGANPLSWDTSNVKDMESMFQGAPVFNQPLGDKFDTSQVLNMKAMFKNAQKFNQPLGDKFDTRQVRNMDEMFTDARSFNQPLGDKFDTSKVLTMDGMFFNTWAFNKSLGDKFDTSQVTTMFQMFQGALVFNQSLGDKFDTSQVTDMAFMFYNARAFTGEGVANWQLVQRPTISNMFTGSLVPNTDDNNTAIWYNWQDGYGYTDADLQAAGLLRRDRPSRNSPTITNEGVLTLTNNAFTPQLRAYARQAYAIAAEQLKNVGIVGLKRVF